MKNSDVQKLQKILSTGQKLSEYLCEKEINEQEILTEYEIQWTITTPLYNIGETIYHISDELKESNEHIPWAKISGLRHRLVHDYEGTNWNIINEIIFEELPLFLKQIEELLADSKQ